MLGIDADPADNSATSIETVNSCVSVASGDTFEVDIFVQNVEDLLAWDLILTYDAGLLEVKDRDVELFQAANEGSEIFDASEDTPDTDGIYTVAALDTAEPPSPDSGSGVLARLTLKARGAGRSELSLGKIDLDGDGVFDRGPLLRDVAGDIMGDEDDDTIFDGPIQDAEVRVDEPCPGGSEGDGVSTAVIAAAVAGGGILVLAAGFVALRLRRRSLTGGL